MDMSSQIAFERAWSKANRLPQEARAIAPTGMAAYEHGVAEGEAENREKGFALDMAAREAAQTEKGREFGLSTEEKGREFDVSTEEKGRQATTSLENRYSQAIQTLDERERQFGGRLSASASQFDRRLAADKEIAGMRLGESSYESIMSTNQKRTQFEQEFAFKAKKFDDEISLMRDQFNQTMSFNDQVFADTMMRQRRDLDTWIQNNRIGSVIRLANTVVSSYGNYKALKEREAMRAENAALRTEAGIADSAREQDRQRVLGIMGIPLYEYDPDYLQNKTYDIIQNKTTGDYEVVPWHEKNKWISGWKRNQIRNNVFNPQTWASYMQ